MYDYLRDELPALIQSNLMSATAALLAVIQWVVTVHDYGAEKPGQIHQRFRLCADLNPCSVPWGIKAFSTYLGEDKMHGWNGTVVR